MSIEGLENLIGKIVRIKPMVIRSETGDIIRARWLPEESDFGKKETICRGQMLLNVGKPTAGKGGPAARPYSVRVGGPGRAGSFVFYSTPDVHIFTVQQKKRECPTPMV